MLYILSMDKRINKTFKMAKRRYVVELTKAQLEALIDCAINGQETFMDDFEFYKKRINKCEEAISCLNRAKINGLKTIKTKA